MIGDMAERCRVEKEVFCMVSTRMKKQIECYKIKYKTSRDLLFG